MGGRIMATTINADTTNGLVLTPDTSGDINLQSAGVTKASITSAGLTVGGSNISPQPTFRNLIINGDMRIDQRNAGASVTPTTTSTYSLDRWRNRLSVSSKYSVQQNAGSVTPPEGFTNYLGVTSLSSYSVVSSDYFAIEQPIEGLNFSHLNYGTANAKTVTFSFWVRSSLTGTFGASFRNDTSDYLYAFSYTISSANTWEKKTITISGATSGTWLTNNSTGLIIAFNLGVGSTYTGTGDAWNTSGVLNPTGTTNLLATSGATLYITGVQLEVGEQSSDFENLQYGTQLALCQRYAYMVPQSTDVGAGDGGLVSDSGYLSSSSVFIGITKLPISMRTTPSISVTGTGNFEIGYTDGTITTVNGTSISLVPQLTTQDRILYLVTGSAHANQPAHLRYYTDASSVKPCFLVSAEL